MEEITKLVSTVGFPIVVAMYSLIRLEKTVQQLTKTLTIIAGKLGVDSIETEVTK
jgi:hypothetical protein